MTLLIYSIIHFTDCMVDDGDFPDTFTTRKREGKRKNNENNFLVPDSTKLYSIQILRRFVKFYII